MSPASDWAFVHRIPKFILCLKLSRNRMNLKMTKKLMAILNHCSHHFPEMSYSLNQSEYHFSNFWNEMNCHITTGIFFLLNKISINKALLNYVIIVGVMLSVVQSRNTLLIIKSQHVFNLVNHLFKISIIDWFVLIKYLSILIISLQLQTCLSIQYKHIIWNFFF
jgi:hypothetical protein